MTLPGTNVKEVKLDYTDREGLDPLVYVDGEYKGSEDQLIFEDLLMMLDGYEVSFRQVGEPDW